MNPQVSVIMPVYNAERYLSDAVESILGQTFTDFEFLIVNDGSKDRSPEILDRYAKQDSRIRLWHRENSGYVSALNFMLQQARGELVARMDADDVCHLERLERQVEYFRKYTDVDVLGSSFMLVDSESRKIGIMSLPTSHVDIEKKLAHGHCSMCHPSVMYRRRAVLEAGCYDESYTTAEDLELWQRMINRFRFANISDPLISYRIHDKSVSEASGARQRENARRATEKHCRNLGIPLDFQADTHWRPGSSKESQHRFSLRYGWMAWKHGHRSTWRHYAIKALRLKPLKQSSWRLLLGGLKQSPARSADD